LVINADDKILVQEAGKTRADYVTFALEADANYRPSNVRRTRDGGLDVEIDGSRFSLPTFGDYQAYNLLAAYALVRELGYDLSDVDTAGLSLASAPLRGETILSGGVTFIVDCYNANPDSVLAGLRTFAGQPTSGRRVVILGDMLELGDESEHFHRAIGRELADTTTDLAVLVGPMSEYVADAAITSGMPHSRVFHLDTADECADRIGDLVREGDQVYLKGSRGIGLEVILDRWTGRERT
jgi:UDP-N-acetylmuramoyl-tripeptide--D-alanyl-D-alanine ligase